jgi:hypothetical protein
MEYKTGDLNFTSRKKAVQVRNNLNYQAKKYNINLIQRILKRGNKYIVRASIKRR